MLRWKIAAVLGVAFGVAGIGWGYAEQGTAPGFTTSCGFTRRCPASATRWPSASPTTLP